MVTSESPALSRYQSRDAGSLAALLGSESDRDYPRQTAERLFDTAVMGMDRCDGALAQIESMLQHNPTYRHPRTTAERMARQRLIDERRALRQLRLICANLTAAINRPVIK